MPEYKSYHHFRESEFLTDEFFQSWIFNPDKETILFWEKYLSDNPGKTDDISRAKLILESFEFKEDFPGEERVRAYLISTQAMIEKQEEEVPVAKIRSINRAWWAAAASVILLLSLGYLFLKKQEVPQIVNILPPAELRNDAVPGGNKAILTLGNGQTIVLDSAGNGTLSTQGSSTVIKLADGKIAYEGSDHLSGNEIVFNTISTPRGGQYNLTLSDGSKVWLNAESSLRFPASFSGNERLVELTGEGYFEVAHNKEKPFKVALRNSEIEVLGTHFNINSYVDEKNLKVTLLEGSIKLINETASVLVKPGQQAVINHTSGLIALKSNVNLEEVIAWKNGLFYFDNTDIKDVMRQVGRWYDLEVVFQGIVPNKKITGKIYRNVNVSKVLRIMDALKIEFIIEGRTVTVTE